MTGIAEAKRQHKIQRLIGVGDTVYSANGGEPMTIVAIFDDGFETEEDFFAYDEVRRLYFLTHYGYRKSKEAEARNEKS